MGGSENGITNVILRCECIAYARRLECVSFKVPGGVKGRDLVGGRGMMDFQVIVPQLRLAMALGGSIGGCMPALVFPPLMDLMLLSDEVCMDMFAS